MSDLIKRSDAIEAIEVVDWYHQNRNKDMVSGANSDEHQAWYKAQDIYNALEAVPSADRPQGEWIEKAISIIDDMQREGIIDYEQAREYRMRARMKGADDETETQNSNLTFEKVMEEIQTQVIEFPDTHQKFIFARKIEMDGDSIKICGWEYKGVKDED